MLPQCVGVAQSAPEVGVGSLVPGDVRLGVGPHPHHLPHFVVRHFVLAKGNVVDEESSTELIGDGHRDQGPPSETEHHIERDAESTDTAELVVPAQVVDASSADSEPVEGHAEGDVARPLFLLLREQELVRLVLELGTLVHRSFSHFD